MIWMLARDLSALEGCRFLVGMLALERHVDAGPVKWCLGDMSLLGRMSVVDRDVGAGELHWRRREMLMLGNAERRC